MSDSDSTKRFSNRVADYIKYRPTYPAQMVDHLRKSMGLSAASVVADIGAGTGILTEILLQNVKRVFAVEPNINMRMSAEDYLGRYKNFTSVNATAEATGLEDSFFDFVFVAQAFHWFDREKSRHEFARILKPEGQLVLIWNDRELHAKPFLQDYEALILKFSTDYKEVREKNRSEADMQAVFEPKSYRHMIFKNQQVFDFAGLLGRLCSSSYMPKPGERNFEAMKSELRALFEKHNKNGKVRIDYSTNFYSGFVNR